MSTGFVTTYWTAITIVIALYVLSVPICTALVASSRGRDWANWFCVGILIGPLGLIAAVGLAPIDREERRARTGYRSKKRTCPWCAEAAYLEAVVCPHCRNDLEPEEEEEEDNNRNGSRR